MHFTHTDAAFVENIVVIEYVRRYSSFINLKSKRRACFFKFVHGEKMDCILWASGILLIIMTKRRMQSASLTLSFVRKSIAIPKLEVESIKDCMVVVGHK